MSTILGQNGNITFGDGTTQSTATPSKGFQSFTSSGTFTIPTSVTSLKVILVGGGGGGCGGSSGRTYAPHNGGNATPIVFWLNGLTPSKTISVTVGGGGGGGSVNSYGSSGGTTQITSGTQSINTVSSSGGAGGTSSTPSPGSYSNGGGYYLLYAAYTSFPAIINPALGGGTNSYLGIGGTAGYNSCDPNCGSPATAGTAGQQGMVYFEW